MKNAVRLVICVFMLPTWVFLFSGGYKENNTEKHDIEFVATVGDTHHSKDVASVTDPLASTTFNDANGQGHLHVHKD